jgi:hypothetical protein
MSQTESLQKNVERALAYAHAAVDEPTASRVFEARSRAASALGRIGRLTRTALTLHEAGRIIALVGQLRAVLQVLDRVLEENRRPLPN